MSLVLKIKNTASKEKKRKKYLESLTDIDLGKLAKYIGNSLV